MISDIINHISMKLTASTPKIATGLIVLLVFWLVAVIVEKVILLLVKKSRLQPDVFYLMARIAKMILIVIGLISGMGTMGINVSAMVASLGLTGFALGFALKDALSNVLSGVLVLIYQPFRTGSRIKVLGYEGRVVCVDLRYTTIAAENRKILIPNSNLFNHPVEIHQA